MRVKLHILFTLFLLAGVTNAVADRTSALTAQAQGDYASAMKLWQELANTGDPVAQYNLALIYQKGTGVNQDGNISRYWLSMAARSGVVGAYTQINRQAVKPTAQRISVKVSLSPMEWVASQNPGYYTLQLASSTNQALIEKYFIENTMEGKAGYYRSLREGELWYALVYGAYPSVNAAKEAIADLPENLKKWSPWVRNIRSIQKLMVR